MKKLGKKNRKKKNYNKSNWSSIVHHSYGYNNFCNSEDVNKIAFNVFGALSISAHDLK